MTNTAKEQNSDLDLIVNSAETNNDIQVAELEENLQKEKDDRCNERFIWTFVCIILFDAFIFSHMPWQACISMVFLELILLLVLSMYFGIEQVTVLFTEIIKNFNKDKM